MRNKKQMPAAKLTIDVSQMARILRERREGLDLSQRDLAHAAGVSQATVHQLEQGNNRIQLDNFIRILTALQLAPDDVLVSNINEEERIDPEWRRLIKAQDYPALLHLIASKLKTK